MIKSWLALAAQAAAVAVLIGLIGLSGKLAGIPWLFASFGPSVALQLTKPHLPMSRAWNVWLGHLIAIGSGLAAVYATGADGVPAFASGQPLSLLRGASDIACPEFRISPVRPATAAGRSSAGSWSPRRLPPPIPDWRIS